MTRKLQPVENLKEILKKWQWIKSEIEDTECAGETWDYLSEWGSETGTAQHALWRGCERIVELCCEINEQINLSYSHPIKGCASTERVLVTFDELRAISAGLHHAKLEMIKENISTILINKAILELYHIESRIVELQKQEKTSC